MKRRRAERKGFVYAVVSPQETAAWNAANAEAGAWTTVAVVSSQLFVWPYLVSLAVGAVTAECKTACNETTRTLPWLVLPVVGPFITAGVLGDRAGDGGRGVLLADGILQTAGLGIALLAANAARKAEKGMMAKSPTASFSVAPLVVANGGGVSLTGSF